MSDDQRNNSYEPIEDSRAIQRKLVWLAALSSIGGVAFALNHRMLGNQGFDLIVCIVASVCGAIGVTIFSRFERLPIITGIIPGLVAGAGAYATSAAYFSMRDSLYWVELIIPSVFGSFPGVVLYIIFVRIYYSFND